MVGTLPTFMELILFAAESLWRTEAARPGLTKFIYEYNPLPEPRVRFLVGIDRETYAVRSLKSLMNTK